MNRHLKYFITLFLNSFLISGLLLHPAITTFSHAASNITPDGTMGTTINQAGNIYNINGGTIKGTNQFHSFGLFSVGTGDTASFNGPRLISNIISRITGGQQSMIDGLLKSTIYGANLYLLNPYGFLFGPNATLDVSGSFHVSTADYLRLSDGGIFYSNPLRNSVLTTAPPVAFGFLSDNPAPISIQESHLKVPEGKALSIIGGDINISGGPTGWLWAPSGRINIASVASPGEIIPVESWSAPDLQMSSFDRLGRINLQNLAYLDVSSSRGNGTVVIRGGKLLIENSYVVADTWGDVGGAKVGIDIAIKDDLVVNGGGMYSYTYASGKAGDININTNTLEMRGGGQIATASNAEGQTGSIRINADHVILSGTAGDGTGIYSAAQGNGSGGNIQVTAGDLQITGGGLIDAETWGQGEGGSLIVTAKNTLLDGGNYTGKGVGLYADTYGSGNAGDININGETLKMRGLAQISTSTIAEGQGGSLLINADQVILSGSEGNVSTGLYSVAQGSGNGGIIQVTAGDLQINDGALTSSGTIGTGKAGNISLTAPWITMANGGGIWARTLGSGTGRSIQLSGGQIQLINGASISAESSGMGNAGDISLSAGNTLQMKNSSITTEAAQADGGNIHVHAGYMVNLIDSKITASVRGGPQTTGGNITIDPQYVILNDSHIIANAYEGKGGNIRIIADVFLASPESIVDASSALGIDGTVDIQAAIQNISGTLAPMQGNFLSAEVLLRDRCAAQIRGEKSSSFVVSGRDGLPIRPGNVLPSPIY